MNLWFRKLEKRIKPRMDVSGYRGTRHYLRDETSRFVASSRRAIA